MSVRVIEALCLSERSYVSSSVSWPRVKARCSEQETPANYRQRARKISLLCDWLVLVSSAS